MLKLRQYYTDDGDCDSIHQQNRSTTSKRYLMGKFRVFLRTYVDSQVPLSWSKILPKLLRFANDNKLPEI